MALNDNKPPWAASSGIDTTNAPPLATLISREFATQYIADRLPAPYDNVRNLRHRIGQKIKTAINGGKLKAVDGQYSFGDLVAWAQSRKDLSQAVADIKTTNSINAHLTAPMFTLYATGHALPTDLPACQAALALAYSEMAVMKAENDALSAEVTALRPLLDKAKARSEAARLAGKKGGRARKN